MRKASAAGLAALAILIAAPGVAVGQRVPSPYKFIERRQDLGPFAAYLLTERGKVQLGPKSGMMYGVQYALRINNPMQLSAFGAYMQTERDVIDPEAEGGPAAIGVEDIDLLLIGGRLQLSLTGSRSWHNLVPYILAGVGVAIDLTKDPICALNLRRPDCQVAVDERFDFGSKFMGQVGIGVVWTISERFGARFTVHDAIWRLRAPVGFLDPELQLDPVPPENEWMNNLQFGAGLSLWF